MTWKDDKDLGPWPFVAQPNKWGYLNNPRWLDNARKFVKGGPDDYDSYESLEPQVWSTPDRMKIMGSNGEKTHEQCGHWHKGIIPIPIPEDTCHIDGLSVDTWTGYMIGRAHYYGKTIWQVVDLYDETIVAFGIGDVANFEFYGNNGSTYEVRFA
jgi:hypothetical protein